MIIRAGEVEDCERKGVDRRGGGDRREMSQEIRLKARGKGFSIVLAGSSQLLATAQVGFEFQSNTRP